MYQITRGQLIVIWVFVLLNITILIIDIFEGGSLSDAYVYSVFLLLFALIFYTIGWLNYQKKNRPENKND